MKTFMDRFYPARPTPPPTPAAGAAERGRLYAGSYIPSRTNFTGPEKVFKLFRPVTVETLADGRLHTRGLWVVKDGLWAEIEPALYRHDGSDEVALFRVQDERIVLLEGNYPQGAYLRLPWYGAHWLHGLIWFTAAIVFLASIGMGASRFFSSRRSRGSTARRPHWHRQMVELMSMVQLAVLLGLLMALANLRSLTSHIDMVFGTLSLVAVLGATLAVTALAGQAWKWRRCAELTGSRWFQRGVALVGVLFSLSLAYWGVLPLP